MSIGIPYSPSGIDHRGMSYVECRDCGERFFAEGDGGYDNVEDSVTKGAARAYALHYVAEHEAAVKPLTLAQAKRQIKRQGPCLICGRPGAYAAHRWLDATLGCVAAGDPIEFVADDHGYTPEELATLWLAYTELLGDQIDKLQEATR